MRKCHKCEIEKEETEFSIWKTNKKQTGINRACRFCQNEYRRNLRKRKKSGNFIPHEYQKKQRKSLEYHIEHRREYYKTKRKDWHKNYRKVNSKRLREQKNIRMNKAKEEGIKEYGSKCTCCNETQIEFLTIDHIYGIKKENDKKRAKKLWIKLKKLGWPKDKYQLLCWNCNCAKGIWGICPHKESEVKDEI
jgi:hypothetical protein